jgi:prevent-host-death family protein
MKKATITEAKNRLSSRVDRVQHDETVVITDRGSPVARPVSAISGPLEDPDGRIARLERRGGIRLAAAAPVRSVVMKKLAKSRKPSGVLDMLLEERREGR